LRAVFFADEVKLYGAFPLWPFRSDRRWRALFEPEELDKAKKRLQGRGYEQSKTDNSRYRVLH
jgi:hypothetical protein